MICKKSLKLLVQHVDELLMIILVLLSYKKKNVVEGNFVELSVMSSIVELMKEIVHNNFIQLKLEVVLKVRFQCLKLLVMINNVRVNNTPTILTGQEDVVKIHDKSHTL